MSETPITDKIINAVASTSVLISSALNLLSPRILPYSLLAEAAELHERAKTEKISTKTAEKALAINIMLSLSAGIMVASDIASTSPKAKFSTGRMTVPMTENAVSCTRSNNKMQPKTVVKSTSQCV